jgi:hypothetical protein
VQLKQGGAATGSAVTAGSGGAVYIASGGTLKMNGGSITGNKAGSFAYGVDVAAGGIMTMTGGSITGNKHKTNTYGDCDVQLAATKSVVTLTMSGSATIGHVMLDYYNVSYFATITIDDGTFSGGTTIDIQNTDLNDKQILKGTAVSSVYNKFIPGRVQLLATNAPTPLTGYSIDSSGYLKAPQ